MAYSPNDAAAAELAHDFNNLLLVISGNASLLEEIVQDAPAKELANEILEASSQGEALVRQILVRTQAREVALDAADLNDTTSSTTRQLNLVLGPDISVEMDLSDAVGEVAIDRAELERCITNLLINARDAMENSGVIGVTTRLQRIRAMGRRRPGLRPGNYAVLAVTDRGCGMSQPTRQRIFEPFFSTKSGRGRGLGLAVVFGIAQDIGGHIEVESRQGHGSTFSLYLPVAGSSAGTDRAVGDDLGARVTASDWQGPRHGAP